MNKKGKNQWATGSFKRSWDGKREYKIKIHSWRCKGLLDQISEMWNMNSQLDSYLLKKDWIDSKNIDKWLARKRIYWRRCNILNLSLHMNHLIMNSLMIILVINIKEIYHLQIILQVLRLVQLIGRYYYNYLRKRQILRTQSSTQHETLIPLIKASCRTHHCHFFLKWILNENLKTTSKSTYNQTPPGKWKVTMNQNPCTLSAIPIQVKMKLFHQMLNNFIKMLTK